MPRSRLAWPMLLTLMTPQLLYNLHDVKNTLLHFENQFVGVSNVFIHSNTSGKSQHKKQKNLLRFVTKCCHDVFLSLNVRLQVYQIIFPVFLFSKRFCFLHISL